MELKRLYLCVHALSWNYREAELADLDDAERESQFGMGDHWPGRVEQCLALDRRLRQSHFELIRSAAPDDGFLVLESNPDLVDFAQDHLGDRCVVCRLPNNLQQCCEALGPAFTAGLQEDERVARGIRGCPVPAVEVSAWGRSKAWALDLLSQLGERGHAFDPATVQVLALGENWVGCGATFPIHMGRALGLSRPIERRFDWINPDWSPMLMQSEVVDQDLEMAGHVRLFIHKTTDAGPTYGRYVAQFWEGLRGLADPPHAVEVEFPPGSVMECDLIGWPTCRSRGLIEYPRHHFHGPMTMDAGCGAHTTHHATVAMAASELPLEEFRAALLAGRVVIKREGQS